MKLNFLIIFFAFILINIFIADVKAVTDDEIIIGTCSAIYPIGNFSTQVVCTQKGNQKVCRKTYRPETIKSCRTMLYNMGLLKPGENPRVLINRLLPSDEERKKQQKIQDTNNINVIKNTFNQF